MSWWFTEQKNAATQRMIEEVETGAPGGKKALAIVDNFGAALEKSLLQMKAGEFEAAASTVYRPYSGFENLLYSRPKMGLENGQTLEAWFADKKASFSPAVAEAYNNMLAALTAGDITFDEARSFVSHMPFAFKANRLDQQFRTDLESVEIKRAEQAHNWVLVRSGAAVGHGQLFDAAVYELLRARWPADMPYKLVFGRPLSTAEERAAAKIYQVYLEGETVFYQAEEEAYQTRGTGDLLTSVSVEWIDRSKNPDAIRLNWDQIEPFTIELEVPEHFSFRFENHRQLANFDDIEAEQRERMLDALKKAIADWPVAELAAQ